MKVCILVLVLDCFNLIGGDLVGGLVFDMVDWLLMNYVFLLFVYGMMIGEFVWLLND